MSLAYCSTSGKVSVPSDGVRAPSATVFGLWTVCSCLVRNDRVASSPAAGSTPITLQPGAIALRGDRRARQQAAAAAGHEQEIERADFLDQLARGGALAGDDVRVIVGRNRA